MSLKYRILDLLLATLGLSFLLPLMMFIFVLCSFDTGSPIFTQIRLGKGQKPFKIYKFRTMKLGTLSLPTHDTAPTAVTLLGKSLRISKLDELPQLFNVLKGDMSLVGPRPCLPEQEVLISERQRLGVFKHKPGITGLAQISSVDMSRPILLAKLDHEMICNLSVYEYFKYAFMTLLGKGAGDRV